jgi:hypothetical protein
MTEIIALQIERQLRDVDQCIMKLKYEGAQYHYVNFGLALKAARLIKRQRKEIEALRDELAHHGVYPK